MSMFDPEEREDELAHKRVVPIRKGVAVAGGGGSWLGDNWLQDLPEGAVFFSRLRAGNKKPFLDPWRIVEKAEDAPIAHLVTFRGEDAYVATHEFSELYSCMAVYLPEDLNVDIPSGSGPDPNTSNVVQLFEIE